MSSARLPLILSLLATLAFSPSTSLAQDEPDPFGDDEGGGVADDEAGGDTDAMPDEEGGGEGEAEAGFGGEAEAGFGGEAEAGFGGEAGAGGEVAGDAEATEEAFGDAPAGEAVGEETEEIVVTGSRIKRTVFSAAAPVEVMTREEIEKSGAQSVEDLIQHMTAATGSGYRGGGGGPGTAQINLRGLGAGATLVLLNGRRVVPSAAGVTVPFVDVSTVPLAAVERIEILKGGASAIYGSDAIAGVVNIITRRDWTGMRAQVEGRGTTHSFDQREGTASVAVGAGAENARVIAGLAYSRSNQLLANQRDFTTNEGPPGGQGGNRSLSGNPGSYIAGGLLVDPDCASAPGSLPVDYGPGQLCTFSFNDFRALTNNEERTSAYVYGEYDLTLHTHAFVEANVSKARTDNITSPSFPLSPRPVVPADHRDNPFGTDATMIGRALGAVAGGRTNSQDDDTLRTALGFKGDFEGVAANTFAEDWEWELYATFGVSRYQRHLPDTVNSDYQLALNSCSDPSDISHCFNPFFSSVLGSGTPNSDAVIRSFSGALMTTVDQHLQTYNAGLSGSLFELPGGDVGLALGGELRFEQRTSQLDHDSNEFDLTFYLGDDDAYADRDVAAGYLELLWPLVEGLELQTAGRLERYSDAGTTLNPSAGLLIGPGELAGSNEPSFRSLQLRFNVSRAFRAPGLYQSFNGSTTIPASIDVGATSPQFTPIRRLGTPGLDPEKATAMSAGLSWELERTLTVHADYWRYHYEDYITPENAQLIVTNWLDAQAAGMPYDDSRIATDEVGGIERVTVSHVNIPGEITVHGIDGSVRLRLDADSAGEFGVGAEASYLLAYEIPRNQVSQIQRPADPMVMPAPPPSFVNQPFCDASTCDVSGKLNEDNIAGALPSLRLNVPVSWSLKGHQVTFVLHYMAALEDWTATRFDFTTEQPRDIDAFVTLDLQYAFTLDDVIGSMTQLRVGVQNLLDQAPPFVDVLDSYAAALHDPRGRIVYASLAQEF